MTLFSALTFCCSRSCGCCSSCMSWSMTSAVLRPLIRPSTLEVADMHQVLSASTSRSPCAGIADGAGPKADPIRSLRLELAPQELQHLLRRLVRLGQHRGAGLGQDLAPGELHHLLGHVRVTDAALGSREVLRRHR